MSVPPWLARPGPGGRPLLLDGALGTELIARGLDVARAPAESFVRERPAELAALHARYVAAGALVLQANTFGATRPRLEPFGLDGEVGALNAEAVRLARGAGAWRVVASVGPTGLDPFAMGSGERMEAAFEEQLAALVAAGVDGLHVETQYHPTEARAAIRASRRIAPRLALAVSFTVALGDGGFQTPFAVPLARMAEAILDEGVDGIGLNCSLEARKMLGPLRTLRDMTELPILVRPQAGQPSVGCRGDARGDTPERFAHDALALARAGADAIGGCCGAGPDHIAALGRALASL